MIHHHKIKRARERAKLSQLRLANEAGCTQQTISGLEAGKFTPSLDLLFELARVLKTNPARWLMSTEEWRQSLPNDTREEARRLMTEH